MLNRSSMPIYEEDVPFSSDFSVSHNIYTQNYMEEIHLHYHNCLEIGYCLKGGGMLFIEGNIYNFIPNTIVFIPSGCIHDSHIMMNSKNDTPSDWKYIFIDLDSFDISPIPAQSHVFFSTTLSDLYRLMFNVLEKKEDNWQDEFILLLKVFSLESLKRISIADNSYSNKKNDIIMPALRIISYEYERDITVEELAKSCNMSISYFRKRFTESLGMCPQKYLNHVRLMMAEHMLKSTNDSILNISQNVGFHTLSSFNKLFKKNYGMSPSEMRKKNSDTR